MEGDSGGAAVSLSHAYQNHSLTSSGAGPKSRECLFVFIKCYKYFNQLMATRMDPPYVII